MKNYRLKNPDIVRKTQQKCYQKNKDIYKEKNREYYQKNKESIKEKTRKWSLENPERVRQNKKKWNEINFQHVKQLKITWVLNNKQANVEYKREWAKANPRSGNSKDSIELQIAMNNVRKRDNNTCQWYGCNLTHRQAPIHVHHIFPRSEYPELELIEQYMICYCANHHGLWHRYRGDYYANLILSRVDFIE